MYYLRYIWRNKFRMLLILLGLACLSEPLWELNEPVREMIGFALIGIILLAIAPKPHRFSYWELMSTLRGTKRKGRRD